MKAIITLLTVIMCHLVTAQNITREDQCVSAIQNGNYPSVRKLIRKGLDVNYMHLGNPLLVLAIQNNNPEMVRLLVKEGAAVMLENKEGFSPLYLAATSENPELCKAVLCKAYQHDLRSALVYAISGEKPENLKFILTLLKDVNFKTEEGNYPVFLAAEKGNIEILKILEDHGARVDIPDQNGENILFTACNYGHSGMVKTLSEKYPFLL
jgi:uncharacterized protein